MAFHVTFVAAGGGFVSHHVQVNTFVGKIPLKTMFPVKKLLAILKRTGRYEVAVRINLKQYPTEKSAEMPSNPAEYKVNCCIQRLVIQRSTCYMHLFDAVVFICDFLC